MTALLVILGSLFAVGCLVGFGFYWLDMKRDNERFPSDQDDEPDMGSLNTDVLRKPDSPAGNS
ncbi:MULTISPECIES: hypothetical protein [Stappiaceae]|jgi:hypothetical protein|uniref:Uncharacterized protein n=1 Tax=Roseibium aggregatum TaxID=187304 RepID=A0A0M6YBR9_9HYPH|nr:MULTISPECIES: hypothetical protein [Stappiaceae]MCR9284126.1 hypothetical protein [Paracoccaceae bacterium]MEC9405106.1 hypothetical protein [Pseudomonadota bacterium]AMN51850.1 hypothetical protein ACP90_04780 [Labrenzia sp. CP4]ERP85973.1 hypothetical protein Q669_16300 [Labrenzia sp. C1B10]ERS06113.1 hypothetical protein Q675_28150 [Labrenzia sp. C1B70]